MEVRPFDIFLCFVHQFMILGTMGDCQDESDCCRPSLFASVAINGQGRRECGQVDGLPGTRIRHCNIHNAHRFTNFTHAPHQSRQLNSFIIWYQNFLVMLC